MKRRILCSLLLLSILASFSLGSTAAENANILQDQLDAFRAQLEASTFQAAPLPEYDYEKLGEALDVYQLFELEAKQDPDFAAIYGGGYINDEDGLTVLLTDVSPETLAAAEAIAAPTEVTFEACDYSRAYLEEIKDDIASLGMDTWQSAGFISVGVSQRNNCVEIGVNIAKQGDAAVQSSTSIWRVLDASLPIRIYYDTPIQALATLRPGAKITIVSNNAFLSIGYRAEKITATEVQTGFVTAGHDATEGSYVELGWALDLVQPVA